MGSINAQFDDDDGFHAHFKMISWALGRSEQKKNKEIFRGID